MTTGSNIFYKIDAMVLRIFERFAHQLQKTYGWTSFTLAHITLVFFVCADVGVAYVGFVNTKNIWTAIPFALFQIVATAFLALFLWACCFKCKKAYDAYGSCDGSDNPMTYRYRMLRTFTLMIFAPLCWISVISIASHYSGNVSEIYSVISRCALICSYYFASCIPLPRYVADAGNS